MKPLIRQLEDYFAKHASEWHHKAKITRIEWFKRPGVLYSVDNVSRRLRDLESDSIIAVTYEGQNAKYRYIPAGEWRERYVPIDKRTPYSAAAWRPAQTRTLSLL